MSLLDENIPSSGIYLIDGAVLRDENIVIARNEELAEALDSQVALLSMAGVLILVHECLCILTDREIGDVVI